MVGKENRLSNLPEGVLCHILSFLGTEDACRTSILSKYWRSLWTMLPNVSFYFGHTVHSPEEKSQRFACFDRFVNGVLDLRKPLGIKTFKLVFYVVPSFKEHHLYRWISGAIDSNIEELDIKVISHNNPPPYSNIYIPLCVFKSETITALKLHGDFTFIPSSTCLPSLKILSMEILNMDTQFHVGELVMRELLCGCPILEEFYISGPFRVVKICAPKLKKLSAHFRESWITKYLEIDAPSLGYLSLKDNRPGKYVIKNLDNVLEAKLSILANERHKRCLFNLFKGLSNVKSLSLSISVIKDEDDEDHYWSDEFEEDDSTEELSDHCLPGFRNLVHLRFDEHCELGLLPSFLQKSPKLEALVIERFSLSDVSWTKPLEGPGCLLSHLTQFTYKGFLARKEEFETLEYTLRNSLVLKTLTVQPSMLLKKKSQNERHRILKKLAKLPRGSKSCKFRFA